MPKKIAIDWDESELRLVAALCSGSSIKVTDAVVLPIVDGNVTATLRSAIEARGLAGTETLVAIGRGKAELRELQLPPVPDEELPEMVRFQAIRSFATAGDSATVDYLVTRRGERGVEMIAAAIGPVKLKEIRETCEAAGLMIRRISLRPLSAAALYLAAQPSDGDTVLIDLLANDAEIVVARNGRVIFVRTVRMPSGEAARPKALASELRRSLVACGATGAPDRVVLWGRESVHQADKAMLVEASGSHVDVLDPFTIVEIDRKAQSALPDHVGRLAPLVGLLTADELHADRLINFLNPRRRIEEAPNRIKNAALIGVPIAAAVVLGFLLYNHLKGLDQQIADLKRVNASMKPAVDLANTSIARTETIDQFLDGDVNWLAEMRRLASTMPPSEQMIVRSISATIDPRSGGGRLQVAGAVSEPGVINEFEVALRDDTHRVVGEGAKEIPSQDSYRWGFTESITIDGSAVRNERYAGINRTLSEQAEQPPTPEPAVTEPTATEPPATEPPATEPPATEPTATDPPATEPPATEPPATEPPATEPTANEPAATEPAATEPTATEPTANEPPATEPPPDEPPGAETTDDENTPAAGAEKSEVPA